LLQHERIVMPAVSTELGVYVDLERLIALEQRGRKVSLLPRQPVHSLLSGRYASRLRGRGLNFEEIRDYRAGDDIRAIDWKVTARLQKPHVRVYDEERDRRGLVIIDQRLSMFFGSRLAMKSVIAAETAAIVAWRVLSAGDRIGAVVFNDRDVVEVKPQRSRNSVLQVLNDIVVQNQALGVGRGIVRVPEILNQALQRAQRLAPHDSTVVIISDFDGADDVSRAAVATLARHNDVIAVLVHDPLQSELPTSGRMTVTDGELQISVDVGYAQMRRDIIEMSKTRLRGVFAWAHELGVPVLPLSAGEDPVAQLHHLLGLLQRRNGGGLQQTASGDDDG
jgi:uncharacterized protein (DUF58 family)